MRRSPALLWLCLLPALNGCLWHTHRVAKSAAPVALREADADQLVSMINKISDSIDTLNATVDFQASVGGATQGKVTEYTSLGGFILLRKPEMVHVVGLVPVLRTHAFELASDGKTFELLIPSQNKLVEGSNQVSKPSTKPLENLRPGLFFDSMIPRKIRPEELVTVTKVDVPRENPLTHVKTTVPEYLLTIVRRRSGESHELIPERVIHFSRVDLMPTEEDSYDNAGAIATQALLSSFQNFDGVQYPKVITIRRPLEEYQIMVTIEKLTLNGPLTDAQFELKAPEGVQVQRLP